jgi:hypothetical protein
MSKARNHFWPCPVSIFILQRQQVVSVGSDLGRYKSSPQSVLNYRLPPIDSTVVWLQVNTGGKQG